MLTVSVTYEDFEDVACDIVRQHMNRMDDMQTAMTVYPVALGALEALYRVAVKLGLSDAYGDTHLRLEGELDAAYDEAATKESEAGLSYRIEEYEDGWRLRLFENGKEAGGGIFQEDEYQEALITAQEWMESR